MLEFVTWVPRSDRISGVKSSVGRQLPKEELKKKHTNENFPEVTTSQLGSDENFHSISLPPKIPPCSLCSLAPPRPVGNPPPFPFLSGAGPNHPAAPTSGGPTAWTLDAAGGVCVRSRRRYWTQAAFVGHLKKKRTRRCLTVLHALIGGTYPL